MRIKIRRKVDVIILAKGMLGKGRKFPKAMLDIGNKNLLERQIEWLEPYTNKVIVACGEDEAKLISHYLKMSKKVVYSIEKEYLGTAGALKKAIVLTNTDDVLIINVDDLTDIDLASLISFGSNTICVINPRLHYGMIELEGQEIKNFREKPILSSVWVNCGVYLLNKSIISTLPNRGSLEKDVFPYIKLRAYRHFGSWHTIGDYHTH